MKMIAVALSLLVGLAVFLEIGYFLGAKRVKTTRNAYEGFSAIEAAVFGIFGRLLSLSFVGDLRDSIQQARDVPGAAP
jgi:hypothetical protein